MRAYVDWLFNLTEFDLYLSDSERRFIALSSKALKKNKKFN